MIEILNGMRETIHYSELTQLRLYHNVEYEHYPNHWHTGIEIIMPVENGYRVIVENQKYELDERDMIVINTGIIHALEAPPIGHRVILQFDLSLLSILKEFDTVLFMMPPALVLRESDGSDTYRIVYQKLSEIVEEYDSIQAFKEASIYSKLIAIYVELCRQEVYCRERFGNTNSAKQQEYIEMVFHTCEYINQHYMDHLTLEQVADISGFSKFHFTRVFKQFTNLTFYDYLNQKRVQRAILLLYDKQLSITEVAMSAGFSSLSTFNRTFKAINGCAPSDYRKRGAGSVFESKPPVTLASTGNENNHNPHNLLLSDD